MLTFICWLHRARIKKTNDFIRLHSIVNLPCIYTYNIEAISVIYFYVFLYIRWKLKIKIVFISLYVLQNKDSRLIINTEENIIFIIQKININLLNKYLINFKNINNYKNVFLHKIC